MNIEDTGNFSNGKLAILHEKELVLNQSDTSNMLKLMEITRGLVGQMKLPSLPKLGNISNQKTEAVNHYHLDIHNVNVTGDKKGADNLLENAMKGFKSMGNRMTPIK